jgi:predicted RNA binding protein YcfA (HicA-like mRNA interferase family)
LRQRGFEEVRTSGSHRILRNAEGKRVTVPYHTGQVLHPKLLQSILRDADVSVDELREQL